MARTPRTASPDLVKLRRQKVVKANELIQQRTHLLSVQEQKIILFLISQLKPDQKEFEYQIFDIIDFCDACGIDNSAGKNYADLRKSIQTLSDKSMWVIGKETDTLMRWISNAKIEKGQGKIEIRFDEEMKPFLLELKNRYTQFDLIYTLTMRSKYSVRLYEILKSYEKTGEPVQLSLDRFQQLIGSEYSRWQDIKRRIVEPAIKEINEVGDLRVLYTTKKKGKAIVGITFSVIPKRGFEQEVETHRAIQARLDGVKEPSEPPGPVEPLHGQLSLDGGEVE